MDIYYRQKLDNSNLYDPLYSIAQINSLRYFLRQIYYRFTTWTHKFWADSDQTDLR